MKLSVMCVVTSQSTKASEVMTQDQASLRLELYALPAAGRSQGGVKQDFVERVRTGYSGLLCAHATSHCNPHNTLLSTAHARGKNVGKYCIRVGKDDFSLCIDEAISDEKRGNCLFSENNGTDDFIEVFVQLSNPPSSVT